MIIENINPPSFNLVLLMIIIEFIIICFLLYIVDKMIKKAVKYRYDSDIAYLKEHIQVLEDIQIPKGGKESRKTVKKKKEIEKNG